MTIEQRILRERTGTWRVSRRSPERRLGTARMGFRGMQTKREVSIRVNLSNSRAAAIWGTDQASIGRVSSRRIDVSLHTRR